MLNKRLALIAASAVTSALLLTACQGEDTASDNVGGSGGSGTHSPDGSGHEGGGAGAGGAGEWAGNKKDAAFFGSVLNGANEVPVEGKAVGDKDGQGLALMRIQGDQVSYAFTFTGTQTPTLGHLHQGAKGVNGDVKIPFFTERLEDGSTFAHGTVTVKDHDLLEGIKTNPQNWYFNLHTDEFPGGAVRGQAYKLPSGVRIPDHITADTLDSVIGSVQ